MLTEIIEDIMDKLTDAGVQYVYSAFDARSAERKSRNYFTVVGISSFESSQPIYSPYTVYIPFKAELELSVTAPGCFSMEDLYSYYDTNIAPVVFDMSGLTCRLNKMSLKFDNNIQRLVICVKLAASGISKRERSTS